MTTKNYGSDEFRSNLRTALDEAMAGKVEAIVERHGKPAAVVISYESWQQLQAERAARRKRHQEARKRMDSGEYFTFEQVEAMLKKDGLLS